MDKISLYLVATPIGNLADISTRAIEVLESVDFIACEDTRNTLKLLNKFNIKKPLISYHEHNKKQRGSQLIQKLIEGNTAALVSDAGMPAISDPGEDIVRLCYENNLSVSIIPGACAAVSALAISGLSTRYFLFEGFLPTENTEKYNRLNYLCSLSQTLIIYEAPHRLTDTLNDLYKAFGDRQIAIVSELTKIYERVRRTSLKNAADLFANAQPKGEFVLVIEGAGLVTAEELSKSQILEEIENEIKKGLSESAAIKKVALINNLKKNQVYNLYTSHQKEL